MQDTPTPSPNGVAGIVCARLHEFTGDPRWKQRSEQLLAAFAGGARELGLHAATYLLALDWHLNAITHLVIVGDSTDTVVRNMHEAALAGFVPRRVVQLLPSAELQSRVLPPALSGMMATGRTPRGYACTGTSCSQPADDLPSWRATLEALRSTVPA